MIHVKENKFNMGLALVRNRAFEFAFAHKYQYVVFLDADDTLTYDYFKVFSQQTENADVAIADQILYDRRHASWWYVDATRDAARTIKNAKKMDHFQCLTYSELIFPETNPCFPVSSCMEVKIGRFG